jgi:hypothetical protein
MGHGGGSAVLGSPQVEQLPSLGMGNVERGKDEKIFHWDCLLPSMGIIVNVLCVKQVGKNEIRNI